MALATQSNRIKIGICLQLSMVVEWGFERSLETPNAPIRMALICCSIITNTYSSYRWYFR